MAILLSQKKRRAVWDSTEGKCWYCGIAMEWHTENGGTLLNGCTVDHLVPQCHGGDHSLKNLVPACKSCNSRKRLKSLEEYRTFIEHAISGVPMFSATQIAYLQTLGITLPPLPRIRFACE